MKTKIVRIISIVSLTLTSMLCSYAQGLYWESMTKGPAMGENGMSSKNYYMPKMFKDVSDRGETIIRLDKKLLVSVNHKDKTYSEMTFDELESSMKKAGGQLDERMKEMQEKLASMPEEQRKMVEKMMGDKMPGMNKEAKVEVTKSDETKTISGYACTKYLVTQDGKDFLTIWGTKEVKADEVMGKEMREFRERMSAMMPMNGKGMAEAMKQLDGFPIQTEVMGRITITVTKIEKRSTPTSAFEVPEGYKKVKSTMFGNEKEN